MPSIIHLVRHGRSALRHDGRWMRHSGVRGYEDAYNAAGIREDDAPPRELCDLARSADVIAASTLVRAVDSARRLAPEREPVVSPLLCELFLEPPRWLPVRLPIEVWDAFSFAQWSYRLWRRRTNDIVARACGAVDWLESHSREHRSLLVVTHGGFRRVLDAELRRRTWRCTSARRTHENWSNWTYTR